MNKTRTKGINILEVRKFCMLAIALTVASVFVYIYSYQLSVSFAAEIQNTESKISNLKSEISEVEFQIVESKRAVGRSLAIGKGFTELEDVVFVKRTQKTAINAI